MCNLHLSIIIVGTFSEFMLCVKNGHNNKVRESAFFKVRIFFFFNLTKIIVERPLNLKMCASFLKKICEKRPHKSLNID